MANILALDTTLGACSAAIVKNGEPIECKKEIRARGHVERLLPMTDELFQKSDISLNNMDYIAVTIGPGTFAGVRVGVSAAKGMALALDVPVIPVTTLEVLAFEFAQKNTGFAGKIAVTIDARRGEIYSQSYAVKSGMINALNEAVALPIEQVTTALAEGVSEIIGSGGAFLNGTNINIHEGYDYPDALYIALLSDKLGSRAVDSDLISPLYLRAPDAVKPAPLDLIIIDD